MMLGLFGSCHSWTTCLCVFMGKVILILCCLVGSYVPAELEHHSAFRYRTLLLLVSDIINDSSLISTPVCQEQSWDLHPNYYNEHIHNSHMRNVSAYLGRRVHYTCCTWGRIPSRNSWCRRHSLCSHSTQNPVQSEICQTGCT